MLPAWHKLTNQSQFRQAMKHGRKHAGRYLVIYIASPATGRPTPVAFARPAAPRVGFIVGKTVGNAVCRHHVTRLLRHIMRGHLGQLPPHTDVVIRALPNAGQATTRELETDVARALSRALGAGR